MVFLLSFFAFGFDLFFHYFFSPFDSVYLHAWRACKYIDKSLSLNAKRIYLNEQQKKQKHCEILSTPRYHLIGTSEINQKCCLAFEQWFMMASVDGQSSLSHTNTQNGNNCSHRFGCAIFKLSVTSRLC